jgi:hypothetical protein
MRGRRKDETINNILRVKDIHIGSGGEGRVEIDKENIHC